MSESLASFRKRCIVDGVVDNNFMTQEDMIFKSPSAAAMFVVGRSSNGRSEWKTKSGASLNDYEKNKEE